MKKLLGIALAVLVYAGTPVSAQVSGGPNLPNRFDANGIGTVSYSLNSGGSFYGQLFNSGTAANWSLGFGSAQSTSGTPVLTWDSNGHLLTHGIQAPAVSSCGTNPSVATGSDTAGDVTTGTSNSNSCTLTFSVAYAAIPHCFCSDRTTKAPCIAQATASTVVLAATATNAFLSTDVLDYVCLGHN